jgi:hypothetical protein
MFRKSLPIGVIVVLVLAMLVTMGMAYGAWTKTLRVDGTVNTGSFNAVFLGTFTDDGGHVDDPNFDAGDIKCPDDQPACVYGGADGARDPSGPGPNGTRYEKAIGHCASGITTDGKLWFNLSNVYPSYYCTVWVDINNPASIPWKIAGERYSFNGNVLELTWWNDSAECGDQVDPGQTVRAGLTIHVLDAATPGASYSGWYEFDVVNWNQFDNNMCTSTPY